MPYSNHIENPDVVIIGSGIMSANFSVLLKSLAPELSIQVYEVTEELSQESSNGWNNAGTGHAGICELSYTPTAAPDGTVDIRKAISICEEFEHSLQFWSYAVASGILTNPRKFISPIPHMSFVHGKPMINFLRARHRAMTLHHFFREMEFSTERAEISRWAPLLLEGREDIHNEGCQIRLGLRVVTNFVFNEQVSC